jgi:hypothetical protein
MQDRHSRRFAGCAPPRLSQRLRRVRAATVFAAADITNQKEEKTRAPGFGFGDCFLLGSESFAGQVGGRSRREAETDRPANGGQFGKLAEGVMMGSERKRARQRA